ncbi:uncharacterized protein PHA67_015613 [Liasis olivaceus]
MCIAAKTRLSNLVKCWDSMKVCKVPQLIISGESLLNALLKLRKERFHMMVNMEICGGAYVAELQLSATPASVAVVRNAELSNIWIIDLTKPSTLSFWFIEWPPLGKLI